MAINLWSAGGRPTSYNPLVSTTTLNLDLFKNYVITFKAKSLSSSKLTVSSWDSVNELHQVFNLTTEMKNYKFEWYESQGGHLYVKDTDTKGDIIIEDIQLVEKPMGVATINGVDGFNSGNWTLHANAKVIDDETLELNATDVDQATKLVLKVQPNTFYSVSIDTGVDSRIRIGKDDGGTVVNGVSWGTSIKSVYSKGQSSFITDSSTTSITVILTNDIAGTFTFKRPMLNLGDIPAPYEPKRGERMVMPVFNDDGTVQINAKPNKRQQLYSWMDNFEGKVSGSEVENPHVSKVTDNASLLAPSIFIAEINGGGTAYPQISSLGNGNYFRSVNTNTLIAQQLFSFNLIELVKRKLGYDVPGATIADKVAWLKSNVSKLTCNWHGVGSSVGGNKASLNAWNGFSWVSFDYHTNVIITKISANIPPSWILGNVMDTNGFVHFLAYAEPSDGVTASTINTDYVELLVDMKPIVNLLDSGVLNAVKTVPKKNLIPFIEQGNVDFNFNESNGSTRVRTKSIEINSNQQYVVSVEQAKQVHVWFQKKDGSLGNVGSGWKETPYIFSYADVKAIKLMFRNSDDSDILPSDVTAQLEEGTISTPHEPYTLTNKPSLQVRQALR